MTDNQIPRVVRVPLGGYIDVEIDPTIEVRTGAGWGDSTEFEAAAVEAAQDAIGKFFEGARDAQVPHPTDFEWSIEAYPKLTSGNMLHVDVNSVEDLGCD